MQTSLPVRLLETPVGKRADEILRACVHCGFCNATCPTYQLTGDELDGPRGRIYLIKDMLEQETATPVARRHLDRCLTCRACETTCPSGVAYGELAEIGRDYVEERTTRGPIDRLMRAWLVAVVPERARFRRWVRLGNRFRPLLPRRLREAVPVPRSTQTWPCKPSSRRVLVLEGCVQSVATPEVNQTLAGVLASLGIEAVRADHEGCCGGLALHLAATASARRHMEENVAALYAAAQGTEAIVSSASGCGVTVKDYGRLLGDSPLAEQARWVARHTRDAAEYLFDAGVALPPADAPRRVAVQVPCSLQHGQRVRGLVEALLERVGHTLVAVADGHLCCGSAGTYSVLQAGMSEALRTRKLDALLAESPDVIATANIGCGLHLGAASPVPVRHWLELLR